MSETTIQTANPSSSNKALVALLLILVASAALRVYMFRGWAGLDDAEYARFANLFAEGRLFSGHYSGPAVFPLRVGVYVPPGILFRLFGVSDWTMVLYPLVLSLVSIILVYVAATYFFGWRAGLIGAALCGAFHVDLDNATKLLPDLPAAFFAAAGVVLIVFVERRVAETLARTFIAGCLAGLAFGVSWLCKETIAYLAPFTLALLVITIRRSGTRMWFAWAGFLVASVSVLVAEMSVYHSLTGDFLFRFHEVERNYRQWENGFFTEGSLFGWPQGTSHGAALIDRLFVSGPRRILLDPVLYRLPFVGCVAAAYAWMRRDSDFLVPGLWLVTLVLMFNFGSSSATEYLPLALYDRYMYLLFFPAIVMVAGFLARMLALVATLEVRPRTFAAAGAGLAAVALILWAAVPILYYDVRYRPLWWTEEVRGLRATIRPDVPVYADAITLRAFEFFAAYPKQTAWIGFEHLDSSEDIAPGSFVIVNKRYIEWLDRNAGMWVTWPEPGQTSLSGYRKHTFYDQAPSTWTDVWKNDNTRVYRVAGALRTKQNGTAKEGTGR